MRSLTAALLILLAATTAAASTPQTYTGKVLPFEIIAAIRNYSVTKGGILPAQVAISVKGGTQADWLATAAFVAEQSIINDVTFSEVELYVPSPWGDLPPQRVKQIAKVYYSGPNPKRSPWPDDQWFITAQGHAPALPDVEFEELLGDLISKAGPSDDPDKVSDQAEAEARGMIGKKYRLPKGWKPDEHVGAMDPGAVTIHQRDQIVVSDAAESATSIAALHECLSKTSAYLFRGCQDRSEAYQFTP